MTREDRKELIRSLSVGMLVVGFMSLMWLSLMNWRGAECYRPKPSPFLEHNKTATKQAIVRNTPTAMKAAEDEYLKLLNGGK